MRAAHVSNQLASVGSHALWGCRAAVAPRPRSGGSMPPARRVGCPARTFCADDMTRQPQGLRVISVFGPGAAAPTANRAARLPPRGSVPAGTAPAVHKAATPPRTGITVTPPGAHVDSRSAPGIAVVRVVAWPPPAAERTAYPGHVLHVGGHLCCCVRQAIHRHRGSVARWQGRPAQDGDRNNSRPQVAHVDFPFPVHRP